MPPPGFVAAASVDPRDALPGVVWAFTPDRRQCLYVNPGAERLLGYAAADWMEADAWRQRLHPDDAAAALAATAECASGGNGWVDYRIRTQQGTYARLRESIQVTMNQAGAGELHGMAVDVVLPQPAGQTTRLVATLEKLKRCLIEEGRNPLGPEFLDLVSEVFGGRAQWLDGSGERPPGALSTRVLPAGAAPLWLSVVADASSRRWKPADEQLILEIGQRVAMPISTRLTRQSLEASQQRVDNALRIARVGYWEATAHADEIVCSQRACEFFGIQPDGPLTTVNWRETFRSVIHPFDHARVAAAMAAALTRNRPFALECRLLRPEASPRSVSIRSQVLRRSDGSPERLIGILQDVSDLRHVESELRDSEARFRAFLDHATDAFYMHDWDGTVIDVNQVACDMLGRTREELIGSHPCEFDPSVTRDQMIDLLKALDGGQTVAVESAHRHKDGRLIPVEVRLRPFWQGDRRLAVATVRDLTGQKRIERERLESDVLLRSIVDETTDAIYLKDRDGRYQLINTAGARLLGREVADVVGRTDEAFFSGDSLATVVAGDRVVIDSGENYTVEERVVAGGLARTFMALKTPRRDAEGHIVGIIGISRDITEVRRLEEQFRHAQKMESVGRLAGGIAHDFNNLLTVINSATELVVDQMPYDWPMRKLLEEVIKAGSRAASLTGQLLAFSRKQVLQPRPVSLSTVLSELMHLLRRLLREDIELTLAVDGDAAVAVVDRGQFEQAIINLVVNARDAMPGGGRLAIETSRATIAAADHARGVDLDPGPYVCIAVTDNGVGMDEVVRRQVFEPFFTTKQPGRGTGLGLAMVYGFIKQSGGHVEVDSRPGEGTTFRMYFPLAAAQGDGRPEVLAPLAPDARAAETVLVVEDEDSVRNLACLILRSRGYLVLEAKNGRQALSMMEESLQPVDLLLSDIVMPEMGGRELAARLVELLPGVRVIFMSGYTDEVAVLTAVQEEQVAFMQKPFTPTDLARKVRDVLDRDDTGR